MQRLRIFLRRTYGGLPTLTWLLCFAAFVNRAGSMVMPFMSIYLGAKFGLSVAEAGRVIALFGLGSFVGSIVGGKLSDRLGPVRLQIGTLLLTAVWMVLMSYVPSAPWFAAGVFVLGVFNDAFRPGNVASVAASCAPYRQTKALTLNRLALNAGWATGPALGGVLADFDYHLLYFVDGGTCALAALVLMLTVPGTLGRRAPRPADAPPLPRARSPWRDGRFLLLLLLASTLCFTTFLQSFQTLSRHLEGRLHFSKRLIGAFLVINPLAIVVLEMPLVHALRRRSHLHVAALGAVFVGLAFPWLILESWNWVAVLCSTATITIGEMLYMPLLGAYVAETAPKDARGNYLGAYFSTFALGFMIAPSLGGWVYDELGPTSLWLGCLASGLAAALAFVQLARRRAANVSAA